MTDYDAIAKKREALALQTLEEGGTMTDAHRRMQANGVMNIMQWPWFRDFEERVGRKFKRGSRGNVKQRAKVKSQKPDVQSTPAVKSLPKDILMPDTKRELMKAEMERLRRHAVAVLVQYDVDQIVVQRSGRMQITLAETITLE